MAIAVFYTILVADRFKFNFKSYGHFPFYGFPYFRSCKMSYYRRAQVSIGSFPPWMAASWPGTVRSGFSEREREGDHEGVHDVGAAVGGGRGRRQLRGRPRGVRHDGDVRVTRRVLVVERHVHVHGAVAPRLPRQLMLLNLQQHPSGE